MNTPEKTWLALGDSYTCAEGTSPRNGWPAQLFRHLNSSGCSVSPPYIIAQNGWTCNELRTIVDAKPLADPFDLVTILIGVNNQYRGMSSQAFSVELDALYRTVQSRLPRTATLSVLWISIPDWGVSPFGIRHERTDIGQTIDEFNKVIRDYAAESGCHWIDITGLSRSFAQCADMFVEDGLHPSERQYERWVDLLAPNALSVLEFS